MYTKFFRNKKDTEIVFPSSIINENGILTKSIYPIMRDEAGRQKKDSNNKCSI